LQAWWFNSVNLKRLLKIEQPRKKKEIFEGCILQPVFCEAKTLTNFNRKYLICGIGILVHFFNFKLDEV